MKKNILYAGVLLALNLGVTSCSQEFLELEPKTGQTEANYYKTEEQALLSVTAIYDAYALQNWQFVPVISDIFSDDAYCGGANVNDMSQFQEHEMFNMTPENNAAKDLWSRCYTGIYRANLYLEKQEGITWVTTGKKERLEAETLFLRAYFYWDLVRHYGYVPIITTVLPNVEDYKSLPQNTPDEIFTQIATDLLNALKSLPADISSTEKGRVSSSAAKALMARIYLYHEGFGKPVLGLKEWTDGTTVINKAYVQAALDQVITSNKYLLVPSYADLFSWTNQNNSESVLEMQYSDKAKSGDWGGWNINGNFSSVWLSVRNPEGDATIFPGWSLAVPSWSLVNEFEAGDPRKDVTIYNADVKMTNYTKGFMNTGYFNKKFMALKAYIGTGGDPAHNFPRNFMDIRYADVLLMAAELWLADNPTKALGYFNQVRTRSLGSAAALSTLTIDAIYHERRVEFGGEGSRKWDLLRRGNDYAAAKINGSFTVPSGIPNPDDFAPRTFKADTWGMFPIPASEIRNANKDVLKQFVPAYK